MGNQENNCSVRYASGEEVHLGDYVTLRVWFILRTGRIVYVPGISPKHKNMEYRGLRQVGVQLPDGLFLAFTVLESNEVVKLRFVQRSSEPVAEVKPEDPLLEPEGRDD